MRRTDFFEEAVILGVQVVEQMSHVAIRQQLREIVAHDLTDMRQ